MKRIHRHLISDFNACKIRNLMEKIPILIITPGRSGSEYLSQILSLITNYPRVKKIKNSSIYKGEIFEPGFIYKRHYKFSEIIELKIPILVAVRDPRDIAVSAAFYYNQNPQKYLMEAWKIDWFFDFINYKNRSDHFVFRIEDFSIKKVMECLNFLKINYNKDSVKEIIDNNSFEKYKKENTRHYRSGKQGQWKSYDVPEKFNIILKSLNY